MKAHRNARIIAAWVRGEAIEYQSPTTDEWMDVPAATELAHDRDYLAPNPLHPDYDYMRFRIKRTGEEVEEQSLRIIAYRLVPVHPAAPNTLQTAALMQCMATGEILDGMGGGGEFLSPKFVEDLRRLRAKGQRVVLDLGD